MFEVLNIIIYSYILYPKLQTQVSVSNTNSVAFALPELTLSCIVRQSRSYFCAWIEWRLPINLAFLRLVSFLCQFYTSWINFNCVFLQFSGPKWNIDREWIGTSCRKSSLGAVTMSCTEMTMCQVPACHSARKKIGKTQS